MRVQFTRYAGKYIYKYSSQGEPHGIIKLHQWEDSHNNLYERVCLNVEGMYGEIDKDPLSGFLIGITDVDSNGKRYCFPVDTKCFKEIK